MGKAARIKTVNEYQFLKSQLLDREDRQLLDAYALSFAIVAMDVKHRYTFLKAVQSEVKDWNLLHRSLFANE